MASARFGGGLFSCNQGRPESFFYLNVTRMEQYQTRPSTIHTDDELSPRAPWKFLTKAIPGGFSAWGVQLILAWVAFYALTALSWFSHLRAKLGNSALAENWGEAISAGDIWEIMENGGLRDDFFGLWTPLFGALALLWALWAGWKIQAGAVGLRASFLPWLASLPTALAIGALPLWALHAALWGTLGFLGGLGIQPLAWMDFFGGPLLRMAFASSMMLQWWLCRLDMAKRMPKNAEDWKAHLKDSFLRLWAHPVQWGNIIFFGVVARAGLMFSALCIGWWLGAKSLPHLWTFIALQLLAAAINAWIIGWALRVAALYWKNDDAVRAAVRALKNGSFDCMSA